MGFFDDVTDKYHECGVENLYMSDKFFRDAYNHTKKLHGVTRKSGRGLPASIMQDELHNRKEQEKYELLSLQMSLLAIVSAHHLLVCLFTILNLFIYFQRK